MKEEVFSRLLKVLSLTSLMSKLASSLSVDLMKKCYVSVLVSAVNLYSMNTG
jgi:hypothetical protein